MEAVMRPIKAAGAGKKAPLDLREAFDEIASVIDDLHDMRRKIEKAAIPAKEPKRVWVVAELVHSVRQGSRVAATQTMEAAWAERGKL